jgi:hypothetical protein
MGMQLRSLLEHGNDLIFNLSGLNGNTVHAAGMTGD